MGSEIERINTIFSFAQPSGNTIAEVCAFPARLAESVKSSVELLSRRQKRATDAVVFSVRVADEVLRILIEFFTISSNFWIAWTTTKATSP